jgi:serine/threonine protein kinase
VASQIVTDGSSAKTMEMPPLVRKIEPGDVIGRCRIIRELGRGGVGTVYLATHQTLQIEVALKVLSPSLAMDNPALAERFIREAQLAARIRHPNVIAVMDAAHDEATGAYFIVMEYVGGGSLSWHLRHGPLPEVKAFSIITGIAHALAIAEENRIVHRDIKPENIMLDLRGTAKLADLGLAKQALDSRTSLTLGGSYMGTPAYMSPDQARDAKVADTRDDIYSLGASFYECLTGEPPFQGETPYNIMSELLTKPSPQPRVTRPEVSRSADLICRKMMAKNRNLRYADARTLLQDLQHAQTFGDAGLNRLEAASLDLDSVKAREQELNYGIETSVDGVYAEPDAPIRVPRSALARPGAKRTQRKSDYGVFGVAALLIALVTVVTLLLAWSGPDHPFSSLENKFRVLLHGPEKPKISGQTNNEKPKSHEATTPTAASTQPANEQSPHNSPEDHPSVAPSNEPSSSPQPGVALVPPLALPVDGINPTNAVPALPVNPLEPAGPIPATEAIPDSAFTARDIAEKELPPATISPTGKAELLRIIGDHEKGQAAPPTWKYFFFDKGAAGNARIVTVSGGRTLKNGEDLVDFAAPYQEVSVLPEDKLLVDSTQALQIAQSLVPGATVSSSELTLLQQKNSVPMWKVTLWTKDADGEEHKLGDVTLLAENGTIISRNLKP